jgi:short-subunit dehydrogenase
MISAAATLYGASFLIIQASRAMVQGYRVFVSKPTNFPERYGKDSWAVVTGASSGIGLGIARHLAKGGMNVFLIANEDDPLAIAKKKIQDEFGVKADYKVVDLTNDDMNYYKKMWDEATHDKVVSVLVNGAAPPMVGDITHPQPFRFDVLDVQYHRNNALVVNIAHAYLSKLADTAFRQRKGHDPKAMSALMTITSFAGVATTSCYNSSYMGIKKLWYGISNELSDTMPYDVMQVAPLWVKTKIIGNPPMLGKFMSEPDEVAKWAVQVLGKSDFSYGDINQVVLNCILMRTNHQIRAWFFQSVTNEILAYLQDMRGFAKKIRKSKGFWYRLFGKDN